MISGAAGALAVVIVALVIEHGVEYLFATVVLMGIFQILFGLFKLGKFIRMVPYSVMLGFVNGLAIVIFLAQFNHFKVSDGQGEPYSLILAAIGLIESLLTLNLIDEMTDTVGKPNRECVA